MKALKRKVAERLIAIGSQLQCVWDWEVTIELPQAVQALTGRLGETIYNFGIEIYNSTCGDGK